MNRPLKQAVREHFERKEMNARQLEQLEALVTADGSASALTEPPRNRRRVLRWTAAIAATVLVTSMAVVQTRWVDDKPMTERIALEVARNHINLKPLDVTTDSMSGIRKYFTDLDFVPMESALLPIANLKLLGGRYCSIQSIPAAQLRVVASAGSDAVQTLYQTEYRKDVFGPLPAVENSDTPVTVAVKGINVHIWVEKGLLLALAEEPGSIPNLPTK